jgi:MFS family permease
MGLCGAIRIPLPDWLVRDARLVIATRALRTFGYGCTSVLLAEMLVGEGFSTAHVGGVLAVAAVGSVLATVVMGLLADRWGRRRCLLVTSALMALAGLAFAFSRSYAVLITAALIGTISPSTNDNTPFSGVEQSILAQTCETRRHAAIYTWYNSAALLAGALGGLAAAGLSVWVGPRAGTTAFLGYAALAGLIGLLFLTLTPAAEAQPPTPHPVADVVQPVPTSVRERLSGRIRTLAALFAVDAFAGGLAVQAILALWLHQRYGASGAQIGLLFFAANLLPAVAQLTAPWLAGRGGLLPTMLVPHVLANLLLLLIPVAPSFGVAAGVLLARMALSKIDVPARQAFVAVIVPPRDRTAAASLTTVARSISVSVSPLASSLLLSGPLMALGAPLILGGAIGVGYDATMWRTFRRVPLYTDETAPSTSFHVRPGPVDARPALALRPSAAQPDEVTP